MVGVSDVKDVLRSFGWECGPEFEKRYITDPWVFNLVNIIENLANGIEEVRTAVDNYEGDGAALVHRIDAVLTPKNLLGPCPMKASDPRSAIEQLRDQGLGGEELARRMREAIGRKDEA